MSFHLFFLAGILGGVLGGMGMGGGTALIPLLVLVCGAEQGVAQGINLLSFLPMALVSLAVHVRGGLVRPKEALWIALPALATSVLFSLLSGLLSPALLRTAFGGFLIVFALFRLKNSLHSVRFSSKM